MQKLFEFIEKLKSLSAEELSQIEHKQFATLKVGDLILEIEEMKLFDEEKLVLEENINIIKQGAVASNPLSEEEFELRDKLVKIIAGFREKNNYNSIPSMSIGYEIKESRPNWKLKTRASMIDYIQDNYHCCKYSLDNKYESEFGR